MTERIKTLSKTLGKKIYACEFQLPYKEILNQENLNGTNIHFDEHSFCMNEVSAARDYRFISGIYVGEVVNLPLETLETYF
jgi:hypothetical protein